MSVAGKFRDIAAQRSPQMSNQLFLDELFDGVDAESGVDYVVDLLREVATTCPVFLITHNPRLKNVGDRIITVQHNGSVTAPDAKVIV